MSAEVIFENKCEACKQQEAIVVNEGVRRCAGCAEALIDKLLNVEIQDEPTQSGWYFVENSQERTVVNYDAENKMVSTSHSIVPLRTFGEWEWSLINSPTVHITTAGVVDK